MKNFCFALCIAQFGYLGQAFGSEAGMPQLNPEFWLAQIFWLLLTFFSLYLIIWKVFLPKIVNNIENRKHKIVNNLHEAQKLKESAEKKLNEYNEIIENSKKEAKKIIEENRKILDRNLEDKKNKINDEINKEIISAETEINILKKSSLNSISDIASETSGEIIKQLIESEVNKSNVAAIVTDVIKKKGTKHL